MNTLSPDERRELLRQVQRIHDWRGICFVCRRELELRSDGLVPLHYRIGPSRTKEDRCQGGWSKPVH